MQFTNESASTLFHYCFELSDCLRPIIGSKQFDEVDPVFWNDKLNELKRIIDGILENDKITIDDEFIKDAHLKIFSQVLNSFLVTNTNQNFEEDIIGANKITKLALKELYGIEL
jgi:hypothetical protein